MNESQIGQLLKIIKYGACMCHVIYSHTPIYCHLIAIVGVINYITIVTLFDIVPIV